MVLLLTEDVANMTDEQREELLRGVTEARISANKLFEILPFDPIPGGDLTYKKKDDDNAEPDPARSGPED